ncbi:unnamed protein product [Musa acuminata subsp. burmannicoides]
MTLLHPADVFYGNRGSLPIPDSFSNPYGPPRAATSSLCLCIPSPLCSHLLFCDSIEWLDFFLSQPYSSLRAASSPPPSASPSATAPAARCSWRIPWSTPRIPDRNRARDPDPILANAMPT